MATTSPHLSSSDFLSALTTLFTTTAARPTGSVFLTQKPLFPNSTTSPDSPSDTLSPAPAPQILIRATDGLRNKTGDVKSPSSKVTKKQDQHKNRTKISTIIEQDEVEEFFGKFAEVCKVGMGGLRKRDRRKGKKGKGGKKGGKA